jgi:hypothetical protein
MALMPASVANNYRGQPGEANLTFKKWLQELEKGRRWPKFAICRQTWEKVEPKIFNRRKTRCRRLNCLDTGLIGKKLDNLTILMLKTPQRGRRQLQRGRHWPSYGHKLIFITKNGPLLPRPAWRSSWPSSLKTRLKMSSSGYLKSERNEAVGHETIKSLCPRWKVNKMIWQ